MSDAIYPMNALVAAKLAKVRMLLLPIDIQYKIDAAIFSAANNGRRSVYLHCNTLLTLEYPQTYGKYCRDTRLLVVDMRAYVTQLGYDLKEHHPDTDDFSIYW